jgi:hypothetical protein
MESSLSLSLPDFAAEIGSYLGFGRLLTAWTGYVAATPYVPDPTLAESNLGQIMNCVQGGYRWFLFCHLPDPAASAVAHKWSFLSPQRTLVTAANVGTYDLPDDEFPLTGNLCYAPSQNYRLEIQNVGPGKLARELMYNSNSTAKPQWCAIYPKDSDGTQGQRFQIAFAPIPDAVYSLTYTANIYPQVLTATRPYPLGGMIHGATIMAAMRAFAEVTYNDEESTCRNKFNERLRASISMDERDFKPSNIGYVGNHNDGWRNTNLQRPINGPLPLVTFVQNIP